MGLGIDKIWQMIGNQKESNKPTYAKATVLRKDSDGVIWVRIEGGVDETPTYSTTANVKPNDVVTVKVAGGKVYIEGSTSSPSVGVTEFDDTVNIVNKNIGKVDEKAGKAAEDSEAALAAAKSAEEAADVARVTGQHFWVNDDEPETYGGSGAHVTEQEKDDWVEAIRRRFPDLSDEKPYHNILMNSLGILLRTALNNLVGITRSAVSFFDGTGNSASNIVARFGKDGAQIGKNDELHTCIDSSAFGIVNSRGKSIAAISSEEIRLGEEYLDFGKTKVVLSESAFRLVSKGRTSVDTERNFSSIMQTFLQHVKDRIEVDATYGATVSISRQPSSGTKISVSYRFSNVARVFEFIAGTASTSGLMSYDGDTTFTIEPSEQWVYFHPYIEYITYYIDGDDGGTIHVGYIDDRYSRGAQSASFGEDLQTQYKNQTALGRYNLNSEDHAFEIGNGTADDARSNAFTVEWDGSVDVLRKVLSSTKSAIIVHGAPVSDASAPQNSVYGKLLAAVDSNDEIRAHVSMVDSNDGRQGVQIESTRTINGNVINNGLFLFIDQNGNRTVYVHDKAAWKKALGITVSDIGWVGAENLVATATANNQEWSIDLTPGSYTGTYWQVWSTGKNTILKCDSDSGRVTMPYAVYSNSHYNVKIGTVQRGVKPSAVAYGNYEVKDANEKRLSITEFCCNTDGTNELRLYVLGNTTSGDYYSGIVIRKSFNNTDSRNMVYYANTGELETSGRLYLNRGGVRIRHDNLNRDGANPSADTWGNAEITLCDVDGERIGFINSQRRTDGRQLLQISCTNENTSGGEVYNTLQLFIDRSGNATYGVSSPANFRSAIGAQAAGSYYPTSGGTVSGSVNIQVTNVDRDAANPSSDQWWNHGLNFSDVSGEQLGVITGCRYRSSGLMEMGWWLRNEATNGTQHTNSFTIRVTRDGVGSYSITNPAAFRSAIGAAASSDRRLKTDIRELDDDAVEFVKSLKPSVYTINGERQVGLIAQDVFASDKWGTRMAFQTEDGIDGLDDWEKLGDGIPTWKLDYIRLLPPTIKALQKSMITIDSLKARIDALEQLVLNKG